MLAVSEIFVKHMKLKQLSEGIRVAAAGAVDYLPFVCISVRWRFGLMATRCEGSGTRWRLIHECQLFSSSSSALMFAAIGVKKKKRFIVFHHTLVCFRCNTLPSRRTLKNSRLVCKKDDVHVCIMCLRAIMNYQVSPPHDLDLNRRHAPQDSSTLI